MELPSNPRARALIERLGLAVLPVEGGWFRQTWQSSHRLDGDRPAGSAIIGLYAEGPDEFGGLHRLDVDEVWHFYAGDPIALLVLHPGGRDEQVLLGPDVAGGKTPQWTVPAGSWMGARLADGAAVGYGLFGTTLAPGWVETSFTLGRRAELTAGWPACTAEIERLTRPAGTEPVGG